MIVFSTSTMWAVILFRKEEKLLLFNLVKLNNRNSLLAFSPLFNMDLSLYV